MTECLIKLAYTRCNCALSYMPPVYRNLTVCGKKHDSCIKNLVNKHTGLLKNQFRCDCWTACSEDLYMASASTTPLSKDSIFLKKFNLPLRDIATVLVFFPSRNPRGFMRRESFRFTDFLCNYSSLEFWAKLYNNLRFHKIVFSKCWRNFG